MNEAVKEKIRMFDAGFKWSGLIFHKNVDSTVSHSHWQNDRSVKTNASIFYRVASLGEENRAQD